MSKRLSPFVPLSAGIGGLALLSTTEAAFTGFTSVAHDIYSGFLTISSLTIVAMWWLSAHPTPGVAELKEQTRKIKAHTKEMQTAVGDLIEAVDAVISEEVIERGPSLGVKNDGGNGYVGLFPIDFFEPYAVCPACGLEALHWMREPYPDEGHDNHTSLLKYWNAQNKAGHAMRDYETIRTCRSCEVHWGQNAMGVFPAPMLGPFTDAWRQALAATPPKTHGKQTWITRAEMENGVYSNQEQDALMAENLPAVPEEPKKVKLVGQGAIVEVNGVRLPDIADAEPKNSPHDRKVYEDADGKMSIVTNGYLLASKDRNSGTWSVPLEPTKWGIEPGAPARATSDRDAAAWAGNFAKAQGDQTLDLTAGAPQGYIAEADRLNPDAHELTQITHAELTVRDKIARDTKRRDREWYFMEADPRHVMQPEPTRAHLVDNEDD